MATSGTSTFNLDITEIAEEAFERAVFVTLTGSIIPFSIILVKQLFLKSHPFSGFDPKTLSIIISGERPALRAICVMGALHARATIETPYA